MGENWMDSFRYNCSRCSCWGGSGGICVGCLLDTVFLTSGGASVTMNLYSFGCALGSLTRHGKVISWFWLGGETEIVVFSRESISLVPKLAKKL